jgi:Bacterial protein of unknown function (DUF882)
MHEDLGSNSPVHIVCGYRSKKTNAFLKRIGRNVAKHSQHSEGKAIDFYFPDVATQKIRNLALYRQVGGVGYYRSAGGPTGFLHVDTARVRHWGPRISNSQMASIMSEGRKFAGRRMTRADDSNQIASATKQSGGGLLAFLTGKMKGKPAQPTPEIQQASYTDTNYSNGSDDLADMAATAAVVPQPKPAPNLSGQIASLSADAVGEATAEEKVDVKKGYPVPLPRQKPLAILALAAANIRITPTSDDPSDGTDLASGQLTDKILEVDQEEDIADAEQLTNSDGKSDFAGELNTATTQKAPTIRMASASPLTQDELALWKSLVSMNSAKLKGDEPQVVQVPVAETPQEINRSGKGSLPRQAFKLLDQAEQAN